MNYYFMRLHSPRSTFPADITTEERETMVRHSAYWKEQIQKGKALVIGPVADPSGAFGMGVLRLTEPAELETLMKNDPAILANIGFKNEAYPMPRILLPDGV
jgi:uncharacterized protein